MLFSGQLDLLGGSRDDRWSQRLWADRQPTPVYSVACFELSAAPGCP